MGLKHGVNLLKTPGSFVLLNQNGSQISAPDFHDLNGNLDKHRKPLCQEAFELGLAEVVSGMERSCPAKADSWINQLDHGLCRELEALTILPQRFPG